MIHLLCILAVSQLPISVRSDSAVPVGKSEFSFRLKRGGRGVGTMVRVPLRVPRGNLRITLSGQGVDIQGQRAAMPPVSFSLSERNAPSRQAIELNEGTLTGTLVTGRTSIGGFIQDALAPDSPSRWDGAFLTIFLPDSAAADFMGKVTLEGPLPFRLALNKSIVSNSARGDATLEKGKQYQAFFAAVAVRRNPNTLSTFSPVQLTLKLAPKGILATTGTVTLNATNGFPIRAKLALKSGTRAQVAVVATTLSKTLPAEGVVQIREFEDALGVTWSNPVFKP